MTELRFAIAGCGKIAPRHAAEIVKHGKLIAVCDIVPQKAGELGRAYNAVAFESLEDLLKEQRPDVLAICTPNGLHATHAVLALDAGSHVLCEKPMSTRSVDALNMIAASKENNRKLFVVKSTRYNPALASLKKAVDSGALGKVYSFQMNCFWNRPLAYYADSWKGDRELDGGTLFTQFSHYIDALLWIFGSIESVSGFRKNLAHEGTIDFEDTGVASISMKNGILGGINWSINTYRKNMEVSLTVIAENGTLEISGEYMNELRYQAGDAVQLDVADPGSPNDYGFYKGSMSNHDKIYDNLVKALADDNHPFAGAADGLKTVETIERIYRSVSFEKTA